MEVSDEIVETFLLDKRAEATRERKMYRYKAQYSLDCDDGIEKAAIGWAQPSPEELLMKKETEQEYRLTLARLAEAINHSPNPLCAPRSQTPASRLSGSTEPEYPLPKGGATHRFLSYSR